MNNTEPFRSVTRQEQELQAGVSIGHRRTFENAVQPSEPGMREMASEAFRHLQNAHNELDQLYSAISGHESGKTTDAPKPESLREMLDCSSELASMLVGRLSTLNSRV